MNARPSPVSAAAAPRVHALFTQVAAALMLGLAMVYGVEFSAAPVAHNAAHDVRHANGRPCH
jgi:cobalt transporter subunit CbtB